MQNEDGIDGVEIADALAQRIDELTLQIEAVEMENYELAAARDERDAAMNEEVLLDIPRSQPRRHSLDAEFHTNEDASLMNETPRQGHLDPAMAKRASYLSATARPDVHQQDSRSGAYLTELWEAAATKK